MDFLKDVLGIGNSISNSVGGFLRRGKKKLDEFEDDPLKTVLNTVKDKTKDAHIDFFSPGGSPKLSFQKDQTMAEIPQFELPKQVKNPVTDFLKDVVVDTVNSVPKYFTGKAGINQQANDLIFRQKVPDVKELLGNVGRVAELPLNLIGGAGGVSVAKGAATQGFKRLGQQGVKQAIKEGGILGGKYGIGFGAAMGAQNAEDIEDTGDYVTQIAKDILITGIGGTLLGGTFGAGSYGVSKIAKQFSKTLEKEVPNRFAHEINSEASKYLDDAVIKPFREAFKISLPTEKEIRDAVVDFQTGKIGDDVANQILETVTQKYLPQFSGRDTIQQSKIWDYILARKHGQPAIEVPDVLKELDKQIFKVVGFDIRQGGYLKTKEFTDMFNKETKKAETQQQAIEGLSQTTENILKDIRVGQKLTPAQTKDLKALRAAINKQAYDIAGVNPARGKQEKSFYELAKEDPDAGDFINIAEEYVNYIDEIIERGSGAQPAANAKVLDLTSPKKSVDELIEASKVNTLADTPLSQKYYHGASDADNLIKEGFDLNRAGSTSGYNGVYGRAAYLTNDLERAKSYGTPIEVDPSKLKLWVLDGEEALKKLFASETAHGDPDKIAKLITDEGYDGVRIIGNNGAEEIAVVNPKALKLSKIQETKDAAVVAVEEATQPVQTAQTPATSDLIASSKGKPTAQVVDTAKRAASEGDVETLQALAKEYPNDPDIADALAGAKPKTSKASEEVIPENPYSEELTGLLDTKAVFDAGEMSKSESAAFIRKWNQAVESGAIKGERITRAPVDQLLAKEFDINAQLRPQERDFIQSRGVDIDSLKPEKLKGTPSEIFSKLTKEAQEDIQSKVGRPTAEKSTSQIVLRETADGIEVLDGGHALAGKLKSNKKIDYYLAKDGIIPEPQLAPTPPGAPGSVDDYLQAQMQKQQAAAGGGEAATGVRARVGEFKQEVLNKVEDFLHPIEDALAKGTKEGKYEILPKYDVRYQLDKALRADTIASQFIKDHGLDKVIQGVDDMGKFNQYLIAKRSLEIAKKTGKETGRDLDADQRVVDALEGQFGAFTEQIRDYNKALREYAAEAGLIPKKLADFLGEEYPDYVPMQRVFNAVEEEALRGGSGRGGTASVSTQDVIKRLKGSEREVKNPLESIVENTAIAMRQGERNKAARMIVSYESLPNNPFNLRKLEPGETATGKHTVSALIDGKKVTYETTEAIADAAKNLDVQQLNILGKFLSIPTRALKIGAVGWNLPFVASNLVRDQIFTSVTSRNVAKTSLLNPFNFMKAAYSSVGHGKLYDEWVREGASFTSFDIARDQVAPTISRIRAGRNLKSKIAYTVTHPQDLVRAVEDIIGTSESLGRIQQYGGTKEALIGKGRTVEDATLMAAKASRDNAGNFGRRGEWGTVLNGAIPFFNAGIQGARTLRTRFVQDPKGTTARFVASVGIPTVTVTAWNLSTEERRAAYEDIPEYEKENNLIILPPNPTQDENGNWNALKIPMTPGLSNLASMVRRQVEGTQKYDPSGFAQVASDIIQASTSVDPSNLLSTFTPQAIKPFIEDFTNTNLFTGNKVVPEYMKDWAPEDQVFEGTSERAKMIGQVLGVSPLRVENFVSTAFAGVGRQILGKNTIAGEFDRRFFTARGGEQLSKIYDSFDDDSIAGVTSGNIDKDVANYAKALKFEELVGKNPYTGIKGLKWEEDRIDTALKLYEGEDKYGKVPEDVKLRLYDEFGIDEADLEYTYSADQTDALKSEYLMGEFDASDLDHKEMIAVLIEGRKESLKNKMLASNGVLDDLYEAGYISSSERTALKKIKLDKEGERKPGTTGTGSGSSASNKKFLTEMKKILQEINEGTDIKSVDALISDLKKSRAPQVEIPTLKTSPTLQTSRKVATNIPKVEDLLAKNKPRYGSNIAAAQELINRQKAGSPQGSSGRLTLRYGGGR